MKRHYPIGLFLLLALLASCSSVPEPERSLSPRLLSKVEASKGRRAEGPTPKLSSIDSLMWQQPDSALLALMAYEGDASEYNNQYAQLLTSELLYKNYYEQTNRPELQQAVAYFDSLMQVSEPQRSLSLSKGRSASAKTTAFLAARAHYINGVGYYERDSVIEACREYLKALEVMEGHFEEKELVGKMARFMVLAYNRLMEIFSAQFMMEPAIFCGERALVFCRIEPTSPFGVSNILYRIGKQYDKKRDKDIAKNYYNLAIENMPSTNNLLYRDMVSTRALVDYQLGLGGEKSLIVLKQVLVYSSNEDERLTRYLTIGDIFFEERLYDSALVYLEPVFENTKNNLSQIQAANYLRIIYDSTGNKEKSDEITCFLADFKKSEGENKALVSQLNDLFQSYLNQKQYKQAKEEREKAVRKTTRIFVPVAVVFALCVFLWSKHRNRKQIAKTEHAHRMEKAALSGRLRKSNEALRELKGQIQQQENDAVSKPEQANSFADEPICQLIMERVNEGQFKSQMDCTVYKDYALGKEQLMALREAADRHFNHFTSRLAQTYPSLTKGDLDYCCLYLLGLTDADVAALMQRAYNTINERNSKLRRIFDSNKPLSVTLRGIAEEVASF